MAELIELQVRLPSLILQYKYSSVIMDKNVLLSDIHFLVAMISYKGLFLTLTNRAILCQNCSRYPLQIKYMHRNGFHGLVFYYKFPCNAQIRCCQ